MTSNLGPFNRAARGAAGMFLLATPILDLPTYPLNLLGLVLIATAIVGYCPIQAALSSLGRTLFGGGSRPRTV
jgi:hypothetical protein